MKGGTQVYGGKLEEVTICKSLRKGKGGKQVKKLKTKFFALSMAFVMILSIIQSGAVPMVQAAGGTDENKVEYELLDQAPMKASVRASSEVSVKDWGDGPATYAFDGNADTTWHTNYDGTKSVLPQSIEWDLGGTYLIGQLSYVRKSTAENGTWKDIVITATLKDGTTKVVYNQAMPETAMGATTLIQFAPVEANHLKVDIRSNYKGGTDTFAAAAEINVYKAIVKEPEPPVVEKPITVTPNTLTLTEGQAFELKYALTPEAQDAGWVGAWDSANTNSGVVKFDVNTGKGVAVGTGDVTIQAKATLTTATGSTTKFAGCKIHVNKAEVRSVIVLNGTEYTAESLEDAIAQFGLTNGNPKENISSIEFKSGAVRDEDLDYLVAHKKWFDFELKSFKIADDVAVYGLSGNEIPGNVFQLNGSSSTSLEHVYLGKNIKGLARGAFSKCYDLKTFEAPGLEYLKENSLARVKVKEFKFPALKKIEEDAFGTYTNSVTTKISLPVVETLEHNTFKHFTNLEELTFGAVPPQIRITANTEFEFAKGVKENLKLNIPDGALEDYMNSAGYNADNGTWYGIPIVKAAHEHEDMSFATEITAPVTELAEGSYYLDKDITEAKTINVSGDVKLCLNGHNYAVSQINVPEGAILTIYDCGENGTITAKKEKVVNVTGGTLNLESGSIVSVPSQALDGAIHVTDGAVNVHGGKVDGGKTFAIYAMPKAGSASIAVNVTGGNINHISSDSDSEYKSRAGIVAYNATTVDISGGTVQGLFAGSGNTVVKISSGRIEGSIVGKAGTTTISGKAEIVNSKDWAIAARGGTMNITGGTITGQIDGIRVGQNGMLNISGGTITGIEGSGLHLIDVRYPDYMCNPNMKISGGTITGKIYGIDLEKFNPTDRYYMLSLAGTPAISGETADILMTKEKQIYGQIDGQAYAGKSLTIAAGSNFKEKEGAAVVVVKSPVTPESLLDKFEYQTKSDLELAVGKDALVLQKPHVHQYTYMAKDNKITESCICGHSASATITAEDAEYTGEEMKTAEVAYTENWVGNKPEIVYENNMEVGTATAKITVEQVTARVSFEITDTTAPEVMVEQNYNEKSNTVTVTLTSNEPLKKPEGWSASDEEGKVFTKVYDKNGIYELLLEDVHGNAVETRFEVDSIKKDITPEKPKPEDQSGKPSKPGKPAVPEKNSSTAVQTGDTTSMVPALIGILVAIVAIGVVIYRKRSKHDKHRK